MVSHIDSSHRHSDLVQLQYHQIKQHKELQIDWTLSARVNNHRYQNELLVKSFICPGAVKRFI